MELEVKRGTLRFERLAARGEEQVTIEGDATLPGSMRDAVTVLSVQAQAHITGVRALAGEALVRGKVRFQVLYTQGDLTRIRSLDTGCSFEHSLQMEGLEPQMRVSVSSAVLNAQGAASSGRMSLRALVDIQAEALEDAMREWITAVKLPQDLFGEGALQKKEETVTLHTGAILGEDRALVREEFALAPKTGAGEVLGASAQATANELAGGSGRISVSGVIHVRVLHRPDMPGNPLITTQHELPYEAAIEANVPENAQLRATAEVMDVMADSAQTGEGRMLRVEAEVRVVLVMAQQEEATVLADVYSTSGPVLALETEELEAHTGESVCDVRESTRLQAALPEGALPIGTVLAAFAQPMIAETAPAGKRLNMDGVMNVTLVYLPADSDIPCSVQLREPFSMTFPVEGDAHTRVQAYVIEAEPGPSTSDRAEIRCVLGLHAVRHSTQRVHGIRALEQKPQEKQEHGFVIVWPEEGESRWETAKRLRVAPESLRPAGKRALMALKK